MIYLQNASGVVLGLSEAKGNKVPAHYTTDGTKTPATVGEMNVLFLQNAARTIYTVVNIVDTWYYTTNAKFNAIDEFAFTKLEDKPKTEKKAAAPKAAATPAPVVPTTPLVLSPEELEKRAIKVIKKDDVVITEAEVEIAADLIDAIAETADVEPVVPEVKAPTANLVICKACKSHRHSKCTGVTSGMHACECTHPKKEKAASAKK